MRNKNDDGMVPSPASGKVTHWGKVTGRVHMLYAIVGPNVQVGDQFLVTVVEASKCPNWTCGGRRGDKRREREHGSK